MIEKRFPVDKAICIGAIVGTLIAIVVLILIVNARGNEINRLKGKIEAVERQAEKEIAEIEKEAEEEKERIEKIIEDMPADVVALEFLDNDDVFERAEIIDSIAREIIEHQLTFFREMGFELVEVHRGSIQ